MKKILLISILTSGFLYSQNREYNLNVKFNEKDFLSSFLTSNLKNEIVSQIIAESDSVWIKKTDQNYVSVLGKILVDRAKKQNDKNTNLLSKQDKEEWEAMKPEIAKSNMIEMYQDVVNRTFDISFMKNALQRNNIHDFTLEKPSYNEFTIHFKTDTERKAGERVIKENILAIYPIPDEKITHTVYNCIQDQMKKKKIVNSSIEGNYLSFPNDEQIDYKTYFKEFRKTCSTTDNDLSYFLLTPKGSDYTANIYVGKKINSVLLFQNMKIVKAVYDLNYKGKEQISEEQAAEYRKKDKVLFSFKENKEGDDLMKTLIKSDKNNGYILTKNNTDILLPIQKIESQNNGIYSFEITAAQYNWENIYEDILFEVFKNSVTLK
ncbi:hypothetical protein BBI01_00960 [Chryseobacterium artocarpi]|uniref:Uncharacterized protein n=1 Tax=Chryseobacterium artocarpi TaxID=1414727 RepID=A0A1B8ZZN9_9FLAO|nr:hypothetical protein [Chryseobacterium artocarpi]OCA77066.1 hypothetical protein BBI01_00960 [Chryseobacterium artocarpi]